MVSHVTPFFGDPVDLTYPIIDDIVDAVVSLGRGCLLDKRDLRKAYRQFPVDPHDYHLLGYTWGGQYYFDTVLTQAVWVTRFDQSECVICRVIFALGKSRFQRYTW